MVVGHTRVVSKQRITKTAESTSRKEQCLAFDGIPCCYLLRLEQALETPLLGCNLTGDLVRSALNVGALASDRVIASGHSGT